MVGEMTGRDADGLSRLAEHKLNVLFLRPVDRMDRAAKGAWPATGRQGKDMVQNAALEEFFTLIAALVALPA